MGPTKQGRGHRGNRGRRGRRGGRGARGGRGGPGNLGAELRANPQTPQSWVELICSSPALLAKLTNEPFKPPFKVEPKDDTTALLPLTHGWENQQLDAMLAWFREGSDLDHEAILRFSPSLTKSQRAAIHASASTTGLGALVAISRGIGAQRTIQVVRSGSQLERQHIARLEQQATVDPDCHSKALLLCTWAERDVGMVLSRDEALEVLEVMEESTEALGSLGELVALWKKRWPSQRVLNSLYHAAEEGDVEKVQRAIEECNSLDENIIRSGALNEAMLSTPLHAAACLGHAAALEMLLQAGVPPDTLNSIGESALDAARIAEQCDAEGVLLRYGATDDRKHEWTETKVPNDLEDKLQQVKEEEAQPPPSSTMSACGTDVVANAADIEGDIEGDGEVDTDENSTSVRSTSKLKHGDSSSVTIKTWNTLPTYSEVSSYLSTTKYAKYGVLVAGGLGVTLAFFWVRKRWLSQTLR